MARWPWARRINPWYAEVYMEAETWFKSFAPFFPEKLVTFDRCKCGELVSRRRLLHIRADIQTYAPVLLAALTYPDADKGILTD